MYKWLLRLLWPPYDFRLTMEDEDRKERELLHRMNLERDEFIKSLWRD